MIPIKLISVIFLTDEPPCIAIDDRCRPGTGPSCCEGLECRYRLLHGYKCMKKGKPFNDNKKTMIAIMFATFNEK